MRKLILLCTIIAWLSSACNKKHDDCTPPQPALTGKWKWVETTGGIAGITTRPNMGETYILDLASNGQYTYSKNSTTLYSGSYTVEYRYCYLTNANTWMLVMSGLGNKIIDQQTLTLYLMLDVTDTEREKYQKN